MCIQWIPTCSFHFYDPGGRVTLQYTNFTDMPTTPHLFLPSCLILISQTWTYNEFLHTAFPLSLTLAAERSGKARGPGQVGSREAKHTHTHPLRPASRVWMTSTSSRCLTSTARLSYSEQRIIFFLTSDKCNQTPVINDFDDSHKCISLSGWSWQLWG